jgi:neutral ceramidase
MITDRRLVGRHFWPSALRATVTAMVLSWLANASSAAELTIGAAQVKITPPIGVPLAGYYHERGADGVNDDLYSRALVLERNGVRAALVSLDLISTRREWVEQARTLIEKQTGIPGGHVMISATHAHTGPILTSAGRTEASRDEPNPIALDFLEALPKLIAQSVREADERREVAQVSAVVGHEASLAFNRRFHLRDGSVGWNPGKGNPNIVKPAGPIDPQVPVVFFETPQQRPLATYVNYAVHLDNVGGSKISADLPFTLTESLARVLGTNHITLWTAGTCGDVNHINVTWPRAQGGQQNAARMGIVLAGEVLRNWPNLKPAGEGPLRVRSVLVKLPLAPINEAEIEQARLTVRTVRDSDPGGFMKLVHAFKVLEVYGRQGKPLEVEVQAITLGDDLAWVSLPGEVFVQLGLDLKLDSPFKQTMIAELANGSIGYIPNRRAYPQGNYEVISARCAEGSGELLVQAAVAMLKEMHTADANERKTTRPPGVQ